METWNLNSVPDDSASMGSQGSMDQYNWQGANAWGDASSERPHPAMFAHRDATHDSQNDIGKGTAHVMRGQNAEWNLTPQYASQPLGSESAVSLMQESVSNHSEQINSYFNAQQNEAATGSGGNSLSPAVLLAFEKEKYSREADDHLHDPGPKLKRFGPDRLIHESSQFRGHSPLFSWRAWINLGGVFILLGGFVTLFAFYPIYTTVKNQTASTNGGYNLGGINGSGQVTDTAGTRSLIDSDTPESAMTRKGYDGHDYELVFSDEFNQDGRTFWPGEDPYWTAEDLQYHQTKNIEWYDPGNAYTEDGFLNLVVTKETMENSHGRGYLGALVTSWNKVCLTGGFVEASISIAGNTKVSGMWPAFWLMGNLGRAGYGGSLQGVWPYSYEACDVGTFPNQTDPRTGEPKATSTEGSKYDENKLSYLTGQRYSACTCPGEDHPGPQLPNGSFVGRGAPEIDIFEATVGGGKGQISQSGQWAPFNPHYLYDNSSDDYFTVHDTKFNTEPNSYTGGVTQQVTSCLSDTDSDTYNSTTNLMKYGCEWRPSYLDGFGTGFITWSQGDQPMWTINDKAMHANKEVEVSDRPVTGEPMYILINLGMSRNFGAVELDKLTFPSTMRVDWVRAYQRKGETNVNCSPKQYPTEDYINRHPEMFQNPNHTALSDLGMTEPKNRLLQEC